MRVGSALTLVVLGAASLLPSREASAYCRTMTCGLPPNWSPAPEGCYPPDWDMSGCPTSNPPGAKVVPVWWRNACVSYDVQKNATRWADYATVAKIVDAAFAKWTASACPASPSGATGVSISADNLGPVDCTLVEYNKYGGPNQNVIVFRDDMWPHNDASNTLGLTTVTFEPDTGELYDADTEINGTKPLSVGDPVQDGYYDLESIITHEMGHFLGLAHSADGNATMFAQYSMGSTSMRSLKQDDVDGLCSIYPPTGTRNVDFSVADGGSIPEDSCNGPTPRHGFTTQCAQPLPTGCACASTLGDDQRAAGAFCAALVCLGIAAERRRKSR
jgi:Matrixin